MAFFHIFKMPDMFNTHEVTLRFGLKPTVYIMTLNRLDQMLFQMILQLQISNL